MTEEAQIAIAFFGAIKGSEWIFKYLYGKRRDKKYTDRVTFELKSKMNEMEINLINSVGSRLDAKYNDSFIKINERLDYVERQLNSLQVSHVSIQNLVDGLKKYFNKEIEKIENQYKIILQAIRGRMKK